MSFIHINLRLASFCVRIADGFVALGNWFNVRALGFAERAQKLIDRY